MRVIHGIMALLLIAFSLWLFSNTKALQPGRLSPMHRENASCVDCHTPWRGVFKRKCLECHDFTDASQLRPEIRFHVAERYCLRCHTEHVPVADMSKMDHTLLNGALGCDDCHYDPHGSLFGEKCRACHRIITWKIRGYRHPAEDRGNCNRCHLAPRSHNFAKFQDIIVAAYPSLQGKADDMRRCWRCHVPRNWTQLKGQ